MVDAFFGFKYSTTSSLPFERIVDDSLDSLPVAPRRWSRDLCHEVVYEGRCSAVTVDPPLYQVRVEERNRIGGRGDP